MGNFQKLLIILYSAYFIAASDPGPPEKPTDLTFSEISDNNVSLHWRSGYDGGSQQYFIVFKWMFPIGGYIQASNFIYDESPDHGRNDSFTHDVSHLKPSTYYKLTVAAANSYSDNPVFSETSVEFWTTGPSKSPTDLVISEVSNNSVRLNWTSGYDGGSKQHFIVFKWDDSSQSFIQWSDFIFDDYQGHGINDSFTLVLQHLEPTTFYKLKVASANSKHSDPVLSADSVEVWTSGPPQKPTNLYITDLTTGSVVLHWTAGYDGGSPQNFMVFKRIDGNEYIQYSRRINTTTADHGAGEKFSYKLAYLHKNTDYKLRVAAENTQWQPSMSDSFVEFSTKNLKHSKHVQIIVGSTLGGVIVIGFLAFLVYMLKFKRMRASYKTMDGTNRKTIKSNKTLPVYASGTTDDKKIPLS